ncbi:MAG: hypothetical protein PVH61_23825 [Candidatus Aminicenantes bacterium]|jgi:hypothetical protein
MGMIKTLAWVIYKEEKSKNEEPGLKKDTISFEALTDKEVLVEPIYGGWDTWTLISHSDMMNPVQSECWQNRQS